MKSQEKRICVVGTGYVGMTSAIGFAELGHQVTGYDIIPGRVRALQSGTTPYYEDGIEDALRRQLDSGRLRFFTDIADAAHGADYVVIAVGTPSYSDGSADLSAVDAAVEALVPLVRDPAVVVLRSTVPVGTTERLAERFDCRVVFAPEFLREGNALADFFNPDRIVVGTELGMETAGTGYADLLSDLLRPEIVTSFRNAELIKGFSNAYLAMKVSFANEVANLCDLVGADALDVLHGIGSDRRIGGAFLAPGIGFGGPCFEKDVKSMQHLAAEYQSGNELLAATLRVNAAQPKRIVDVLDAEMGGLAKTRIAVWGLTFKAGTNDVRDSLAVRIVDDLIARGASPVAYDPTVLEPRPEVRCSIAPSAIAAADGADALLVLTDWPQFAEISPWAFASRLRRGLVVDGRNILDADAVAAAGLRYRGVGRRPASDPGLAEAS